MPTIKLKLAPTRGKITIKTVKFRATNLKHCLAIETPAYMAIYRADQDFSGDDVVELEITEANGKQRIQRLTISIGKGGGGPIQISERPSFFPSPLVERVARAEHRDARDG